MSEEPGWYPDPYFLGRERYWDGGAWTEECRSAETKEAQPSAKPRPPKNPEAATPSATAAKAAAKSAAAGAATATRVDTTPAPTPPTPDAVPAPEPRKEAAASAAAAAAAAATGAAFRAGGTEETPAATTEAPAVSDDPPTQPVEAAASAAAAAALSQDEAPPVTTEVPAATEEDAETSTETLHDELAGLDEGEGDRDEPLADDKADDDGAGMEPPRRRRRLLIGAAAVVVLVIVVGVVVVLTKGATPPAGSQVAQAASATVGQRYAAVNVDVNMKSGDKAAESAVSGYSVNGTIDFASSLGALNLAGPGNEASEQMVLDNDTIYLDPGALVGQLVKNKVWISATPDDLGSTSPPSGFAIPPTLFEQLVGNPTTLLHQLQANGATATAVGSSIYHGTPVEEYSVTLSPEAINSRVHGLPPSLRGVVTTGPAPERVFLTSNGLVRAISVPITVQSNGARATGHVVIGFSSWGQVVDISAPPASQVVTWSQFKAVLNYTSQLG